MVLKYEKTCEHTPDGKMLLKMWWNIFDEIKEINTKWRQKRENAPENLKSYHDAPIDYGQKLGEITMDTMETFLNNFCGDIGKTVWKMINEEGCLVAEIDEKAYIVFGNVKASPKEDDILDFRFSLCEIKEHEYYNSVYAVPVATQEFHGHLEQYW